jgi:Fe-S-cluster containining protein
MIHAQPRIPWRVSSLIPSLSDAESQQLSERMLEHANAMAACGEIAGFAETGWLPDRFFDALAALYAEYDEYIHYNISASRLAIRCQAACSRCCHQVVHGVYSFEVIGLYRALHARGDYPQLHDGFLQRANQFQSLLAQVARERGVNGVDQEVLTHALRRYMTLNLACPLLVENRCSAYADRPVSCRMYHSLTDPIFCVTPQGKTFNLDLPQSVQYVLAQISDRLAFPYSDYLAQGLVAFGALRRFRPWAPSPA